MFPPKETCSNRQTGRQTCRQTGRHRALSPDWSLQAPPPSCVSASRRRSDKRCWSPSHGGFNTWLTPPTQCMLGYWSEGAEPERGGGLTLKVSGGLKPGRSVVRSRPPTNQRPAQSHMVVCIYVNRYRSMRWSLKEPVTSDLTGQRSQVPFKLFQHARNLQGNEFVLLGSVSPETFNSTF